MVLGGLLCALGRVLRHGPDPRRSIVAQMVSVIDEGTCTPQTCKNVAVQMQDNAYTWKRKGALNDSTVTHRDQRYDKKEEKKDLQGDVISSRCLVRNFYQNQSLELARSPPGL